MIISCLREDMSNALQIVQRAISGKSIMPALSGVMLKAEEDKIYLHATDLEIYLRSAISGKTENAGSVLVNGKLFSDIVRNIDSEMISLESTEGQLDIKGGSFNSSLRTLPVEDFPVMPEDKEIIAEKVSMEDLHDAVNKVVRAASKDDKRPVLQGVLIELREGTIYMVSTDSYRLASTEIKINEAETKEVTAIIPAKAMQELHRWGTRGEGITISRTEGQIRFDMENNTMLAREIEGKFPNWRQLMPESQAIKMVIERGTILSAVKRVSLIGTTVVMDIGDNRVTFSSENREIGRAEEEAEASVEGENIRIAFNSDFLTDGVSACGKEEIVMTLDDPEKPGVIFCEGEPYRYLIMPIKL